MKTNGIARIATAFAAAFDAAANIGSKLGEVCTIARAEYRGAEVPKEDAEAIANKLAELRGWEGNVAKVRKSEARKVLTVYSTLPEGIKTLREEHGGCNWRDALKLATKLKENDGKLRPALAAFKADGNERGGKKQITGRVASALKAWYKKAKADKRADILKAAEILNIKLSVKVEH